MVANDIISVYLVSVSIDWCFYVFFYLLLVVDHKYLKCIKLPYLRENSTTSFANIAIIYSNLLLTSNLWYKKKPEILSISHNQ